MTEGSLSLFDEDEEDVESTLSSDLRDELRNTIVYNLDWTVAVLLAQLQDGAIDLQPQYQRRDAWSIGRKSKLIESLILGLPIPHIVLAERHDAKGSFIILDGKQRLTALAQFAGLMPNSKANGFALRELPVLANLEGITFATVADQEGYRNVRNAFLNQPMRTAILRGWKSDDLLHLVFHRLNSQVVPLSQQELRQALIRGPFMGFLNLYSAQSSTIRWLLGLDGPDFRMRDSELLLRLVALTVYGDTYRGDLSKFLDNIATGLSLNWGKMADATEEHFRAIEDAIELWGSVVGKERVGRKFTGEKYEARLNRAVLDAQVYAAMDTAVAEKMREAPSHVRERFEDLMSDDEQFRRAVEATTKSVDAVRYRMTELRRVLRGD